MSESETWEQERALISAAIQNAAPERRPEALLTGWVVVAEWMDANGDKWLTRYSDESVTAWLAEGMLSWASGEDWEPDGPDDE